jgi:DNA-binding HxlR family transcriptional regulator
MPSTEAGGLVAHQTVSEAWNKDLVPTAGGRTRAPSPDCPVEVALAAIAGRWTTLVLRDLMHGGPRSYTELADALPQLSNKVLADRLSALVAAGLVERAVTTGFPRRTDYRITARGRELRPLLIELYRTGLALQGHDAEEEAAGPH